MFSFVLHEKLYPINDSQHTLITLHTTINFLNSKLINWETMKHHGGDSNAAVDANIFKERIWMLNKVASYLH